MREKDMSKSEILNQQKQKITSQLSQCNSVFVQDNLNILVQSDFIVDAFYRYPQWLTNIINHPPQADERRYYQQWLNEHLTSVLDEIALMKALRLFRRYILVRLEWSQLTHTSDDEQILNQLSELAQVIIVTARDWLYELSCK